MIGIVLILAGGMLLPRPLTSLLVLLILVTALPALAAAVIALRLRRRAAGPRVVLVAATGVIASVVLAVLFAGVARVIPFVVAIAVVLGGVPPLLLHRLSGGAARAWSRSLGALACVAVGVSCWMWQDLTAVAAGFLTALGLICLGILAIVRAFRRARVAGARWRRSWVGVVRVIGAVTAAVVAVGLTAASFAVLAPTHRADDFYEFSGDIPSVPGTVVRTEPYDGEVPVGAAALRILYSSTYSDGHPALVSAVVEYPLTDAEDGSRTVLAWEHGTTGVAQECAPSLLDNALSEEAIPGIGRAIANGWVVVATDYPGQGTSGRYPYLIGEGEGRAALDAARAVVHIEDARASSEVLLWGHSQGGHAALWAGQIAESYAPELHVRGVAALSAAADPLTEARTVVSAGSAISSVATPYMLVPYADEYPDIEFSAVVHPAGTAIVDAMASRCAVDSTMLASVLSASAVAHDAPLFALDLESGPIAERLGRNIADGIVPAPLFLGQGVDDEVIPISMQRALAASLNEAGRDVEVREYEGRSHMGVVAAGSPLIDDLFAWAASLD
ncbi:alpha/beta fold hydrolase [Microbacterium suwonense]|uniref:alpha/beta fold hydrolase n=1 Tax=Microbacterium suwonense TaxID=683047 RepID=UPI0025748839|nr:alpha/beta fold hydrolase [Microbacterium suwonense]